MRNREIGGSGVGATVWDWPIGRNHCNKTLKTFSKLLEGYALRVLTFNQRSLNKNYRSIQKFDHPKRVSVAPMGYVRGLL